MNDNLYNVKNLIALCQKYRLSPSKKYGQNYLISSAVIDKIIAESDLKKTDTVVEVGPGFGVLTFALASKVKKVIAFEIEKKLVDYWENITDPTSVLPLKREEEQDITDPTSVLPLKREEVDDRSHPPLFKEGLGEVSCRCCNQESNSTSTLPLKREETPPLFSRRGLRGGLAKENNIKIIWGNVLKEIESQKSLKSYKVVANLPYQITSSVIRKFLELDNQPSEMILMVQKEVGERICAKPGQMSILSTAVQFYGQPKILLNVPRTKFFPSPKVDSVVIKIRPHLNPPLKKGGGTRNNRPHLNPPLEKGRKPQTTLSQTTPSFSKSIETNNKVFAKDFFRVVKVGFSNKRKMLLKNLKPLKFQPEELQNIFTKLNLDVKIRAQELSVEQWIELTKLLI